jgi:DNA-binding NarL/FixJ family response regulator
MMKKIKVLLADDHLLIRNGIKLMLNKNSDFEIVMEANNGKEVIDYLENNANMIDVVLMDINMPIMDGIEAARLISKYHKNVNVLALTMHTEEPYITKMLKAGVLGYILKETGTSELVSAIKSVAMGNKYFSNEVSVTVINSLMNLEAAKASPLSERELEVLRYIAVGLTNKKIAVALSISARTIETHRRNILEKLKIKNTAEMIKYAIENKLTP